MSALEMIHGVILELAYKERFDLVDQVVDRATGIGSSSIT